MQTLVFDTTEKTVKLYEGFNELKPNLIIDYDNITTVKCLEGYYECLRKNDSISTIPVLRVGISSTNMIIRK